MRRIVLAAVASGALIAAGTGAAFLLGGLGGNPRPPVMPGADGPISEDSLVESIAAEAPGGSLGLERGERAALTSVSETDRTPPQPGRLVVHAVDSSGHPLQGVQVVLRSTVAKAEAVTGDGGEARFPELVATSYTLKVLAPSEPELTSVRRIELAPGESKRVSVRVGDFEQRIAGQVVDRQGSPVPEIEVQARRHLFQPDEGTVVARDEEQRCVTDDQGFFEIERLEGGDYELLTASTERYGPARSIVRSGAESVRLVVTDVQRLLVRGRVRSAFGVPLERVVVRSRGQELRQTGSRQDGSYGLMLALDGPGRLYSLTFDHPGYRTASWTLDPEDLDGSGEHWLDVQLEPAGSKTRLTGFVRSTNGAGIGGERVTLTSRSVGAQHQAVSSPDGRFLFRDVEVGTDYRLTVRPRGDYEDHSSDVVVSPSRPPLQVVLSPLEAGHLRGAMVDVLGSPVPGITLWARSSKARGRAVPVVGDGSGRFDLEGVPAGELSLETRSMPRFTVRGVELSPGVEKDIPIVLDVGDLVVSGFVTNAHGAPLPGSVVTLRGSHRDGAMQSSSLREAVADAVGGFAFVGVGPGSHELRVSATGHANEDVSLDAGRGDVVVRMVPVGNQRFP